MHVRALLVFTAFAAIWPPVFGQKIAVENARVPMTEVVGSWRFHTGDNPAWADPGFDDSAWSAIRADRGWSSQGYAGYGGVAWYRVNLELPAKHSPLALYIPGVDVSCQIFANGRLIQQNGSLPPHPLRLTSQRMFVPLPDGLTRSGHLELAIRVWSDPNYRNVLLGGLHPAPRIGEAQAIDQWRWLAERRLFWENSFNSIQLGFNLLGMFTSLGLFVLRPREREYLWFCLYLLAWSMFEILSLHSTFFPDPFYLVQWLLSCFFAAGMLGFPVFLIFLFRQRRAWLVSTCVVAALLLVVVQVMGTYRPAAPEFQIAFEVVVLATVLIVGVIVWKAWRTGNREAKILAAPIALEIVESAVLLLQALFPQNSLLNGLVHFITLGIQWPVPAAITNVMGDLLNLFVLAVLILRFAQSRQDEERLKSEIEAARVVQHVLVPAENPSIPGFETDAVYKPAGQVGGDFYQIVPTTSGGALIVIGDVSGKGMPAAMTVSLLVGTFRTLAQYTQSPGEILCAMNRSMLARSRGGFTTCLVLRVDPDGAMKIANAGHIAPIINGAELPLENELPLGLSADSAYPESMFHLNLGEQLTLMTDGVVEARSKTGELYGFQRAAEIATDKAEIVARTAQEFGQEDDITVLTLKRRRVDEAALIQLPTSAMSTDFA